MRPRPFRISLHVRLAIALLFGAVTTGGLIVAIGSTGRTSGHRSAVHPLGAKRLPGMPTAMATSSTTTATTAARRRPKAAAVYGIAVERLRLVDPSRTMRTPTGVVRRTFVTVVRYPVARASDQSRGPFPLIVFGHGFAVSPTPYSLLLDAWTRAGYVVAAPIFPLENADAPGGPSERDLVNQPGDMSLVITALVHDSATRRGRLGGIVDPRRIAVAGQSDGGDTALATAYDPGVRDRRVRAAIILSGAEDPFAPAFKMPHPAPPLLAIQGTADTINPPNLTYTFYTEAGAPKFLLRLLGAGHLPPYTQPGPDLSAVEHTTLAFLGYLFKDRPEPLRHLVASGGAGDHSALTAVTG